MAEQAARGTRLGRSVVSRYRHAVAAWCLPLFDPVASPRLCLRILGAGVGVAIVANCCVMVTTKWHQDDTMPGSSGRTSRIVMTRTGRHVYRAAM